ncbi:MAG: hypothetical protein ACOYMS_00820 [Terrimicrobiaceae bacterium]
MFFPSEEPQLHGELQAYLDWLGRQADGIAGLKAFLLAGGYGRGEGGIFYPPDGSAARLYNDLEFYLFAPAVPSGEIASWVHEGEERLGLEIEIKVMDPARFEVAQPSMFYYDLLSRHVLIAGDGSWVDSLPSRLSDATTIPREEGSRLLVNRGTSLLRCRRWAQGEIALPAGFCERILAKLKLALSDSVLCLTGRYNWSCLERDRRLSVLQDVPPDWDVLRKWHAEGVAFKFRPTDSGRPPADWIEPIDRLRRAWLSTFLWIEERRLSTAFRGPGSYAGNSKKLFPDEPALKNVVRQIRDLRRPEHLPFCWGDHPRSRIWKALVLLLDGSAAPEAARLLGAPALRGMALEEHCRALWKHYP